MSRSPFTSGAMSTFDVHVQLYKDLDVESLFVRCWGSFHHVSSVARVVTADGQVMHVLELDPDPVAYE